MKAMIDLLISTLLRGTDVYEVIMQGSCDRESLSLSVIDTCSSVDHECRLVLNLDTHSIDHYGIYSSGRMGSEDYPLGYDRWYIRTDKINRYWVDSRKVASAENGLYVYGAELEALIDHLQVLKLLVPLYKCPHGHLHITREDRETATIVKGLMCKATNAFDPIIRYHNSNHDIDVFMDTLRSFGLR